MKEKDWFKYRGYPHISNDVPISKRKIIENYVNDRSKISRHSFLPFISKSITVRRYKRVEGYSSSKRSHKVNKEGVIKSSKKIRTIMYSCHQDAHIYAYYAKKKIGPKYEEFLKSSRELNQAVIAYRRLPFEGNKEINKNNIYFAKEVFDEVKKRENCVAVLFDIENFFPSLNHKQLKAQWCKVLGFKSLPKDHYNLYKSITNYSFIRLKDLRLKRGHFDERKLADIKSKGKHSYFYNVKEFLDSDLKIFKNPLKGTGIPQGLPISALLANIYMSPFDEQICEKLVREKNVFYRRYSDDMIFICDISEVDYVKGFIEDAIDEIKLDISKEKTEVVSFELKKINDKVTRLESTKIIKGKEHPNFPLSYLGFEFYGYKTLLKSKNLSSFYREMKDTVNRKAKRVEKVKEINLIDDAPLFKRKIYRLYSYKGVGKRDLIFNNRSREYRGNFIKYAYKCAEIMDAPEIRYQVRNHWSILQNTISKHDFSNKKVD